MLLLKVAAKLAAIFAVGILILYFTVTIIHDHSAIEPGKRRFELQITNKGQFEDFVISAYAADGSKVYEKDDNYHRTYYDIPASAALMRIERQTSAFHKTKNGGTWTHQSTLLREVPIPPATSRVTQIRIDTDPSFDVSTIGFLDVNWNCYGGSYKFTILLFLFLFLLVFIVSPLSTMAAVYSLWKERAFGITREFCGSWFQFAVGMAWLCLGLYFHVVQHWFPPQNIFHAMGIFLLPGYPLYFLAELGFNREERARQRALTRAQLRRQANTYTYQVFYDRHGNYAGDNQMSSAAANKVGSLIGILLVPILLPVGTFFYMFLNFLFPILAGNTSWVAAEAEKRMNEQAALEGQPQTEQVQA